MCCCVACKPHLYHLSHYLCAKRQAPSAKRLCDLLPLVFYMCSSATSCTFLILVFDFLLCCQLFKTVYLGRCGIVFAAIEKENKNSKHAAPFMLLLHYTLHLISLRYVQSYITPRSPEFDEYTKETEYQTAIWR